VGDAQRKLDLCLSGGGYRAALFHLGALRRLNELELLDKIDRISSVSGGSILVGFIIAKAEKVFDEGGFAVNDFEDQIAAPFRAFVKHDLRTIQAIRNFTINFVFRGGRLNSFIKQLRKHLGSRELGSIPEKPHFTFCATDMSFGVNWEFSRDRIGSYQAGYFDPDSWPLAEAVAASACFPPVFGPLSLKVPEDRYKSGKYKKEDRGELIGNMQLTDGGVYDNLGLEPVWPPKDSLLLVSDCGAPFEFQSKSKNKPLRLLMRYSSIIQAQSGKLRVGAVHSLPKDSFAYWTIRHSGKRDDGSLLGYPKTFVDSHIEAIRTDLDLFSDNEAKVLENHGYAVADRALQKNLAHILPATAQTSLKLPHADLEPVDTARNSLADSHRRLVLGRLWKSILG
jgi:NTE family protein